MLGDPLNRCQRESRLPQERPREACGVGAEGPASPGRALLCSVKANPEGGAGDAGRRPTARPRDAVRGNPDGPNPDRHSNSNPSAERQAQKMTAPS